MLGTQFFLKCPMDILLEILSRYLYPWARVQGEIIRRLKNNNKIHICRSLKVIRSDDSTRSDGGRKREKIPELILGTPKLKAGGNNATENTKPQKQKETQGSLMTCKPRKRVFSAGRTDKLSNAADKSGQMRTETWSLDWVMCGHWTQMRAPSVEY